MTELSKMDRCDACSAAALHIWEKLFEPTKRLILCGHHSAAHSPALLADGWYEPDLATTH